MEFKYITVHVPTKKPVKLSSRMPTVYQYDYSKLLATIINVNYIVSIDNGGVLVSTGDFIKTKETFEELEKLLKEIIDVI